MERNEGMCLDRPRTVLCMLCCRFYGGKLCISDGKNNDGANQLLCDKRVNGEVGSGVCMIP